MPHSLTEALKGGNNGIHSKPFTNNWNCDATSHPHFNKSSPNSDTQRAQNCEALESSREGMVSAQSFDTDSLLPHSLHRTLSLPVDAVDV